MSLDKLFFLNVCLALSTVCFSQKESEEKILFKFQQDSLKIVQLNQKSAEFFKSDPKKSIFLLNEALEICRKTDFLKGEATTLRNIGSVYYFENSFEKAVSYYLNALVIDESIGNKEGEAMDLTNIGNVYYLIGNTEKALENYNKALAIEENNKNDRGQAVLYNNLGNIFADQEYFEIAIQNYNKAIKLEKADLNYEGLSKVYSNIGSVYKEKGNPEKALKYFQQSLEIDDKTTDLRGLANNYSLIGNIYHDNGDLKKALTYYNKALEIEETLSHELGLSKSYSNLGLLNFDLGKIKKSHEYYLKALEIDQIIGSKRSLARDYTNLGMISTQLKKTQDAIDYYNSALEIYIELNDKRAQSITYSSLGELYAKNHQQESANLALDKAIEINNLLGTKPLELKNYFYLPELYAEKTEIDFEKTIDEKYLALKDSIFFLGALNDLAKISPNYTIDTEQIIGNKKEPEFKEYAYTQQSFVIEKMFNDLRENNRKAELLEGVKHKNIHVTNSYNKKKEYYSSPKTNNNFDELAPNKEDDNISLAILAGGGVLGLLIISLFAFKNNTPSRIPNANSIQNTNSIQTNFNTVTNSDFQTIADASSNADYANQISFGDRISYAFMPFQLGVIGSISNFLIYKNNSLITHNFFWSESVAYNGNDYQVFVAGNFAKTNVTASLIGMLAKNGLIQIVQKGKELNPSLIIESLNNFISSSLKEELQYNADLSQLGVCVVNNSKRTLNFSGKSLPLLIATDENIEEVFDNYTSSLDNNTQFYLFSNALQDAKLNASIDKKIKNQINSIKNAELSVQKSDLLDAFKRWSMLSGKNIEEEVLVIGLKA